LRPPSEILERGHGTSIDLALLLASCLEYVEIYPALILLRAHAFPAYWRSESFHDDFVNRRGSNPALPATSGTSLGAWYMRGDAHADLMKEVKAGRLVPLETIFLTQRLGFREAIEAGIQNLSHAEEFDSVVDVMLARKAGVTPLPLAARS
jgi:hypothetical protein